MAAEKRAELSSSFYKSKYLSSNSIRSIIKKYAIITELS